MTESGLFKHPLSGGDLLDSRFEKLTLPLRSRAHLRDYGSYEHPMLRHRLNDAAWAWIAPYLPAARSGVGGHARPTCAPSLTRSFTCCEPVASGVSSLAPRVPAPRHRLPAKMQGERGLLCFKSAEGEIRSQGSPSSSTTVLKTGTEETAECARASGVS